MQLSSLVLSCSLDLRHAVSDCYQKTQMLKEEEEEEVVK